MLQHNITVVQKLDFFDAPFVLGQDTMPVSLRRARSRFSGLVTRASLAPC